ncbi:MAG: hypothetical protein J0L73_10150 [Verrucomicrobia bacterium]|nr:hypothetical protein [Verrucomicrobiota bacterium]
MRRERVARIAEREGLCSVSSNTKWQRIMKVISSFPCYKRLKFIDVDEPTQWAPGLWQASPHYIEGSGGPEEFKFVEWVEIEKLERRHMGKLVQCCILDHSDEIRRALEQTRASFNETDASFMILGYTRPTGALLART